MVERGVLKIQIVNHPMDKKIAPIQTIRIGFWFFGMCTLVRRCEK